MPRTKARKNLTLKAHIRSVKTKLELSLSEISTNGCRVVGVLYDITPDQLITIRPEGLGEMSAAVIWVTGDEAGLEFDFPLHPQIVDCLSRIHPPEGKTGCDFGGLKPKNPA